MAKQANPEMEKAEKQLQAFESTVQTLTLDRMNEAPLLEVEEQTKISQKELANKKDIFLKPFRSIGSREKFNETYREEYNAAKEYVYFTAENHEIIGEDIDIWTKPFAGLPAEWWKVPVNKPVWGPRYLAEQISRCKYHRLRTEDKQTTGESQGVSYYGSMVVDNIVHRLDAKPVIRKTNVFLGANSF